MILDTTPAFPSFPAKHVIFRGEEAAPSSAFCFINDFACFEFPFVKNSRSRPFSVPAFPFAFTSFVYNVIISTNRKWGRAKFNADSEERFPSTL